MAELIAGSKPSKTGVALQEKKTLFALPSLVEYSEIFGYRIRHFVSYVKEVLKILLGSLYFAKLSFSEVDGYSLFFLYSAIASARRCSQPALSSKNLL